MNWTLAGVTTDFSFSAVRAPKRTGIMGSISPWHCRMAMSLFTPLLAACRQGGREEGGVKPPPRAARASSSPRLPTAETRGEPPPQNCLQSEGGGAGTCGKALCSGSQQLSATMPASWCWQVSAVYSERAPPCSGRKALAPRVPGASGREEEGAEPAPRSPAHLREAPQDDPVGWDPVLHLVLDNCFNWTRTEKRVGETGELPKDTPRAWGGRRAQEGQPREVPGGDGGGRERSPAAARLEPRDSRKGRQKEHSHCCPGEGETPNSSVLPLPKASYCFLQLS